jgi:hypothetical protein
MSAGAAEEVQDKYSTGFVSRFVSGFVSGFVGRRLAVGGRRYRPTRQRRPHQMRLQKFSSAAEAQVGGGADGRLRRRRTSTLPAPPTY